MPAGQGFDEETEPRWKDDGSGDNPVAFDSDLIYYPSMVLEIALLSGLVVAGGSLLTIRLMRGVSRPTAPALQEPRNGKSAPLSPELADLKHALSKLQYEEGIESLAEQALGQFQQSQESIRVLQKALGEKFETGEITYARYDEASRRVAERVVESLRSIRTALEIWSSGKNEAAEERRASLTARTRAGQALPDPEKQELHALDERSAARQKSLDDVRALLGSNERALRELDRVTTAIREIGTSKSQGTSSDTESLIGDLESLAQQAKRYSSQ